MAVDAKAVEQAKNLVRQHVPDASEALFGDSPESASAAITSPISDKFPCVSSDADSITAAVNEAWISAAIRFQESP